VTATLLLPGCGFSALIHSKGVPFISAQHTKL
jgi:hypothetical protein